jgi:16S rRNA (guanine527-N7)-methyltransferase
MTENATHIRPLTMPLTADGFAKRTGVSRETFARLQAYVALLGQWNSRINLISRNTMSDVWRRHILDSAQLYPFLPPRTQVVADLGSGAGLPGLILAAMGVPQIHLIESDQRKCAFLREAARVMDVPVTIHAKRIEQVSGFTVDVITARALASLDQLIEISGPFRKRETLCLFLKGENAAEELAVAQARWRMKSERLPSLSDASGTILKLESIEPLASA